MKCTTVLICFLSTIAITSSSKTFRRKATDSYRVDSPEEYQDTDYELENRYQFSEMGKTVFNLKGKLRKSFALETALTNYQKDSVCSPLSALLPLAKLALGAKGKSRKELLRAIGVGKKSSIKDKLRPLIIDLERLPGVSLTIASKIYLHEHETVKSEFRDEAKKIFKSDVEKINFNNARESANTINEWVSKETRGMIPFIINESDIEKDTSNAIIINAVYFSGNWKNAFDAVTVDTFYSTNGDIKVPMMSKRRSSFYYTNSSKLDAQIIELPYDSEGASFIVVLPRSRDGLPILLRKLKLVPEMLEDALRHKKMTVLDEVNIPKFKVQSEWNLKRLYEKVGVHKIFDNIDTGLKNIVNGDKELRVSQAKQKAIIQVHEFGTQGSAASTLQLVPVSLFISKRRFEANRPFLFFVKVRNEQLFAGVYNGA